MAGLSKRQKDYIAISDYIMTLLPGLNPDYSVVYTGMLSTARVDYLLIDSATKVVKAAIEFKVRVSGITLKQLRDYDKDIMIDESKLKNLTDVSKLLGVPTYLWNFFLKEGVVVSYPIADGDGQLLTPYNVFPLQAQKNANYASGSRTKVFAAFHGRHRRELFTDITIPEGCTKLSLDELQHKARN